MIKKDGKLINKCTFRNCKDEGHYSHDLLIKGRKYFRLYCTHHHRIAKQHEIKKGYRWEDDLDGQV